jgi:hypothetical protein
MSVLFLIHVGEATMPTRKAAVPAKRPPFNRAAWLVSTYNALTPEQQHAIDLGGHPKPAINRHLKTGN